MRRDTDPTAHIHGKSISQQNEDNARHTEHDIAMIYRLENQLSICQMRRKMGRCKCLCSSAFFFSTLSLVVLSSVHGHPVRQGIPISHF